MVALVAVTRGVPPAGAPRCEGGAGGTAVDVRQQGQDEALRRQVVYQAVRSARQEQCSRAAVAGLGDLSKLSSAVERLL